MGKRTHQISSLVLLALLSACGTGITPEQITKVEQNFDKIKPGMTKAEVESLTGKPFKSGTWTTNISDNISSAADTKFDSHPVCELAPCSWDVWALSAKSDDQLRWPIVMFDRTTNRVIKAFKHDLEYYFSLSSFL